ncbi:hypothetical protein HMPREF9530_01945 [Escherichia coli MS 21-1]|nr:hypothetical protein HMPREF9530_01945 [Escherichia coli MS 21-1]EGE3212821.1 hypothetical protein [Escherichia coli]HAH0233938.1 hypothetical protein [Escherichia coli]
MDALPRFELKRWYARDVSNSLVGKLRRNCGEVAGKNFTVDAEQSFWLALVRTMYSVSLIKLGECDKDGNFCSFR